MHVIAGSSTRQPASSPWAPTLETARLHLVPPAVADLEDAAAMWAHPAVYGMIGGRPFTREEVWQRLLRYIGHWHLLGYGTWTIRARQDGAYLGSVGLMLSRRATIPSFEDEVEAGWTLVPHAHGQGYAREALGAMLTWADANGIAPVLCIIDDANLPSIRLAERCGFRPAGTVQYREQPVRLFRREKPPVPPLMEL
ncbi:GNAT family N-acetyltransferase [Sphingomonas gellani]|nr:GNAT family N-acetyltransferase [Sphingomonas gellani]